MKMKRLLFLLFALATAAAQGQCPDCTPDETCVSEDLFPAICPEILPDATAGAYYETVVTFFLPSTIVDPESGIEASLLEVVINSVSGIPFGLDYEANSPNNTYYPSNGDNYGCTTICGTPLISGEYEVSIGVTVLVSALGFEQTINESFVLPLTVIAGEGGNTSFAYDNLFGCGVVETNFEALIDGAPGITSYTWDFGNGNSSDVMVPPTQTYADPGEYTVSLETVIQNFVLQSVSVNSLASGWAGDVEELTELFFSPDPYFVITDSDGGTVYTSDAITDVESGNWNNIGLLLDNPPYSISIYDQDNGGLFGSADDFLGSTSFGMAEGTLAFNAGGSQGNITQTLEISNVFNNEETVIVFPIPFAEFTFLEDENALDYDDPTLDVFLWTFNGDTVQNGAQDSLLLLGPGVYQCSVTSTFGCEATSSEYVVCPEISLVFNALNETLEVGAGFDSYTWFFNDQEIENATSNIIDATELGNYSVTITTSYGCEVSSEVFQVAVGVQETSKLQLLAWPNPSTGWLSFDLPAGEWLINLTDATGKQVLQQSFSGGISRLDLSNLPNGVYLLSSDNQFTTAETRVVLMR